MNIERRSPSEWRWKKVSTGKRSGWVDAVANKLEFVECVRLESGEIYGRCRLDWNDFPSFGMANKRNKPSPVCRFVKFMYTVYFASSARMVQLKPVASVLFAACVRLSAVQFPVRMAFHIRRTIFFDFHFDWRYCRRWKNIEWSFGSIRAAVH